MKTVTSLLIVVCLLLGAVAAQAGEVESKGGHQVVVNLYANDDLKG